MFALNLSNSDKRSKVLFPTKRRKKRRILPSSSSYAETNTLAKLKTDIKPTPKNNKPLILYETNCGTSIQCRIISNFINLQHIPITPQKICLQNFYSDSTTSDYTRTKLPALNDNGFFLYETGAILRYLSTKKTSEFGDGEKSLLPMDPMERAKVEEAHEHFMSTIYMSVANYIHSTIFKPFFCAKCEVETESCFLVTEANNYIREIEAYLEYISHYYFRSSTDSSHLWPIAPAPKFSLDTPNFYCNKSLCPCDFVPLKTFSKNSPTAKNKNCAKKKLSYHRISSTKPKPKNSNSLISSPWFTPLNSSQQRHVGETTMDRLCGMVGYADSLDGVKQMVQAHLKRKNAEKKISWKDPKEVNNSPKLFVLLQRLTLADITLFCILEQLALSKYELGTKFPVISEWKEQIMRNSVIKREHEKFTAAVETFKNKALEKERLSCDCRANSSMLCW